MTQAIVIKNVSKNNILNTINLEINNQEIISIMGFSGSGKTTLLNLMSGLDKPSSGLIEINGVNLTTLKEPKLTKFRAENISYIFQDYKLIDYLTIKENILITQRINKQKIDNNKLDYLIKSLNLEQVKNLKINYLSGGQKQRVAIARALIGNNNFIFADEPTGALDLITRDQILKELINNVKHFQKTLIIVTHDPYVAQYSNRIIFIDNQQIESIHQQMELTEIENKMKALFKNV
ncbi:ABC transporter ATP-binding protein [Spiroplasma sp. SV19]|uniref:ABC transporter ATP-binding protein n=1 Tax=Spiroplasma sp. SV19 TaxID=2570468 RepID=UPI0024B79412|nr:ABC transporter ATP-binding protein [Spiroplasma sp. SV19]WHQ36662.1 ATP-binding cassette domain-containing protein [Spiroplasma sp. SV19]